MISRVHSIVDFYRQRKMNRIVLFFVINAWLPRELQLHFQSLGGSQSDKSVFFLYYSLI